MAALLLICAFVGALFLSSETGFARDAFDAPDGIVATSATLADVLAAAQKADGSDKPYYTRIEEARISAWGLKGKFREVQSGDDFKATVDLGIVSWQRGRFEGQPWRRNENGLVTSGSGARKADSVDAEAIAEYRTHPNSEFKLLGETSGTDRAYVIALHPRAGRLSWLFFNKRTHLLTRAEVPYNDERDTWSYRDFRKTGTQTSAWHVHYSNGVSENDVDYVTTSLKYDAPVAAADIAIPQPNEKFLRFPDGVSVVQLPASLVNKDAHQKIITTANSYPDVDRPGSMTSTSIVQIPADPKIVIQVAINGRLYPFYLDSGANGIFVSSNQAANLGLQTFGPTESALYGQRVHSLAIVPKLSIGSLVMTDVIVNTLPGWRPDEAGGQQVVGLVGFDFLANAVVAIDYQKGSVTATDPFAFVPSADALALPAILDFGVPLIAVQIGQASSERFMLDTGSPKSFVFNSFALAHPEDFKDQGNGLTINHVFLPTYGFSGVAGDIPVRATEVKTLTVGGVSLADWVMFLDLSPHGANGAYDGIIGYDFLRYFTVYLDYPQNEVFLVANSTARSDAIH